MQNQYDNILELTSIHTLNFEKQQSILDDFAYEFQWKPSDVLNIPSLEDIANAHLVIEHGLENTAVISFLKNYGYSNLNSFDKKRLLGVSYNNLIDWHINIERDTVTYVYNRTKSPTVVHQSSVSRDNMEHLRSEAFEKLIGRQPSPNIPALDDALIRTISYWKRELSAFLDYDVTNAQLSTLFNAIIFTRALEDHKRKIDGVKINKSLLDIWDTEHNLTLSNVISRTLGTLGVFHLPEYLLDINKLAVFNKIDERTSKSLLSEFYRHENVPYEYDFSLMSKHALSRIYEHYVSVLRIEDTSTDRQLTLPFLQPLPEEERNKEFGSVYTPQYIARFFAKYLKQALPQKKFLSMKYIDPAVGSGIFLRTLLEMQFEEMGNSLTPDKVKSTIQNTYGIDLDENAVQATKLSLSLLHLVLTDDLPENLNIFVSEAIEYYRNSSNLDDLKNSFDVVIANPPYISLGSQQPEMRDLVADFMRGYASGKIDMYLAFLFLGLEMLKEEGYGLFVLPHSFLMSKSASNMRRYITEKTWIRCLADLSAIRVFNNSSIYVILLILQKKPNNTMSEPKSMIIKCQEFVGRALQDALEGQRSDNVYYSVYDVEQSLFEEKDEWIIPPPTKVNIENKFRRLPVLEDFMYVRTGVTFGAGKIFIVKNEDVPNNEREIYIPYIPDREMERYTIPKSVTHYFIYPYINGEKITEQKLATFFPKTWNYLQENKAMLSKRTAVRKGSVPWWHANRPRLPDNLLVPKIISPHLSITPRFSLDFEGNYAIARSPLLYPKEKAIERDLLLYFLGILNSTPCYWYIALHSHRYGSGYAMLEPKTLRNTPVPSPMTASPKLRHKLIDLVSLRLQTTGGEAIQIEAEIDHIVSDLYGLTTEERFDLGIE